ncbi:hypothetical protein ACTA71_012193 [Dictyostelium dimigraforme]
MVQDEEINDQTSEEEEKEKNNDSDEEMKDIDEEEEEEEEEDDDEKDEEYEEEEDEEKGDDEEEEDETPKKSNKKSTLPPQSIAKHSLQPEIKKTQSPQQLESQRKNTPTQSSQPSQQQQQQKNVSQTKQNNMSPLQPSQSQQKNTPSPPFQSSQTSQQKNTPISSNNGIEKRLMITKMVMENFKSYAGVQEVGPFHKCFSSVVGPNGSGKSNVIDAMLFVFGYRAKQIRLNKISELIHNSENHKNLTNGRVSVHFQEIIDLPGEDNYEVVKGSEFVVTRTAQKTGSGKEGVSKYYLNDKVVKLDDLKTVLKDKGIDLDNNRFLILQGEVEQIAMMKPKGIHPGEEGLLEYLEDIIGSKKYLADIEATGKLIEDIGDKRTSSNNRMKVVEKERDALQQDRDIALEYIDKELKLIHCKSIYFQIGRAKPELEKKEIIAKQELVEKQLEQELETQKVSNDKLLECEKNLKQQNKQLEELNRQLGKCKNELLSTEKKGVRYKEETKHLKTKIKKNNSVIEEETKKQAEFERSTIIHKQDIVRFEKEYIELPKELVVEEKKLEKMLNSLKGEVAELQREMEEKQKQLLPWSKKHSEAKAVVDLKTSELAVLSKDFNSATQNLDDAIKALEDAKTISSTRKNDITKSKKELESVKSLIIDLEKRSAGGKVTEEGLYRNTMDCKRQLEQIKTNLSENTSRNTILNRLLEVKENGQISGIHGRLGDFGAIDPKYDVAISTAAFSQMDNIIVETTAAAEECVQLLRTENLGRATFMILENLEYQRKNLGPIQTPNNTPRLFDLIKMKDEEKYSTAFFTALGHTLVANTLEEATKIAYGVKRYRVVTLDGSLIDISGAMSGGGLKPRAGAMNSKLKGDPKEDKKKLLELQDNLSQLDSDLRQCRDELVEIEKQIQQAQHRKSELELELPKMDMDIKAAITKCEELTKVLPQLKNKAKLSTEKKEQIDAIKESLVTDQKSLDKIQEKVNKLGVEIQEIQGNILNVGGPQLKMQKNKVESLQSSIDSNQTNTSKANVQIKSLAKSMEKSIKVLNENTKEKEENEAALGEIQEKYKLLEKENIKATEAMEVVSEQLREKEEETKEIKKEHEKAKKVIEKIKVSNSKLETQIEEFKNQINEMQAKIADCLGNFANQAKKAKIYKDYVDESLINQVSAILTPEEIEQYMEKTEQQNLIAKIHELTAQTQKISKENINIEVIKDFQKKEQEYQSKKSEFDDIERERDNLSKRYESLRKNRLDEFMAGFTIITMKLKEIYQMITLGGDAELEIIDREDPFQEGISFSVRPPKKSWKNISNLSGGEKTLSSLALVFALHHYKPNALYVMDEIDAALDFKNVSIIANYIKERTKNAQFIIISLRNYMFELADRLVGIYKTDNCTKSVTINPNSFTSLSITNNSQQNLTSQK